jgi:hypothetical protein
VQGCKVLTATVPKIAPLAPTDGEPTREKFPPKTLLRVAVGVSAAQEISGSVPKDASSEVSNEEPGRTHFTLDL